MNEPTKTRKAVTPQELAAAYTAAQERERKREYKWRHTRQGSFESRMLSLDAIQGDKLRGVTSLGSVVATKREYTLAARRKRALDHACRKLVRAQRGHLVLVLRLIAKNGKNRQESIWEIMMHDTTLQDANTIAAAPNSAPFSASKRAAKVLPSGQGKKS